MAYGVTGDEPWIALLASDLRGHLSLTDDAAALDSALVTRLVIAAALHVESLLGFGLDERYALTATGKTVPEPLAQAILMLGAWWYEQRETASEGAREVPFGVSEILREYREYTF